MKPHMGKMTEGYGSIKLGENLDSKVREKNLILTRTTANKGMMGKG